MPDTDIKQNVSRNPSILDFKTEKCYFKYSFTFSIKVVFKSIDTLFSKLSANTSKEMVLKDFDMLTGLGFISHSSCTHRGQLMGTKMLVALPISPSPISGLSLC